MQISKKLYTTLIIAVLTMSTIMAAIPMASAVTGAPGLFTTPYPASGTPTTEQTVGYVGDAISVIGNSSYGTASPFSLVTAYWDSLSGAVLGSSSADINGNYRIDVVIPSAVNGTHYIVVDDGTLANGTEFEVLPSLTTLTTRALPGDSVTVTGNGFAANDDVVLTLNSSVNNVVITTPVPTSNGTGSFTVTFTIPAIAVANYSTYNITGTDEAGNTGIVAISIDYYILLTPTSGPTGITTTISGRIPANTAFELRFNNALVNTGTSSTDGSYSYAYTIPGVLSPAIYAVDVIWETVNNRTANFTVNSAPQITLGAGNGVAGAVVTVSGTGFSGLANITLYFGATIVNSTTMNSAFGPTTYLGAFTDLAFVVPTLTPGVYSVQVVDQYGAASAAGVYFTIDPTPTTQVVLRGSAYYPGDALSFNIVTTETSLGTMTVSIMDPSGAVWWTTTTWGFTGTTTKTVLYQDQIVNGNPMVLPADAPLGSWNWTVTYTPTSTSTLTKATALFTVSALPTMQTVLDRLDEMEATITDVITTTENDIIAVVNTKTGTIMTDISSLDAQLTSIDGGIATISTSIGDIQTTLAGLSMDALGADITTIKNGVATIQTNLGTVSTAVSNLDAKLTNVQGDVATVITNLGTLDGKITSIDGNVATVETDVGTIQADVSDVKASADQTPVWIAVVLSLVAAIAAIFAVITIRQKIAG